MSCEEGDAWIVEGELCYAGLTDHVYGLVDCVELPHDLLAHAEAAEADPDYVDQSQEWFEYISEQFLLLPIEQSCNAAGLLLPWDMRAVRLSSLPDELLAKLHFFFDTCPRHVRALLAHEAFWLVRFERLQRRDSVEWSTADVDLSDLDNEGPEFSRPNGLTARRYAG